MGTRTHISERFALWPLAGDILAARSCRVHARSDAHHCATSASMPGWSSKGSCPCAPFPLLTLPAVKLSCLLPACRLPACAHLIKFKNLVCSALPAHSTARRTTSTQQ
eukprot:1148812-Pelagomonas_calceolata.AAC.5